MVDFLSHPAIAKSAKVYLTQEHLIPPLSFTCDLEKRRVTKIWGVQCACKS